MEQPANKEYKYKEFSPPGKIKKIVEKLWVFESALLTGSDIHFNLLSDYTSSLIFTFPQNKKNPEVFVSGPNSQNIPFKNLPQLKTIGIRFHPLMLQALFKISPVAAKNKAAKLQNFVKKSLIEDLKRSLKNEPDIKQRISCISEFIAAQLPAETAADDIVMKVISRIVKSGGLLKLEAEYSALPISQRQFQRNFVKAAGLTPKEFCRIARFHMVTRKLVKNNFRHFDTLVESGYYDQSHYYREFKEFLGMLPSRFETRQKKIDHEYLVE